MKNEKYSNQEKTNPLEKIKGEALEYLNSKRKDKLDQGSIKTQMLAFLAVIGVGVGSSIAYFGGEKSKVNENNNKPNTEQLEPPPNVSPSPATSKIEYTHPIGYPDATKTIQNAVPIQGSYNEQTGQIEHYDIRNGKKIEKVETKGSLRPLVPSKLTQAQVEQNLNELEVLAKNKEEELKKGRKVALEEEKLAQEARLKDLKNKGAQEEEKK